MTAPENMSAPAIHRLTTAVWALTALVAINVGLSIFSEFRRPPATASADPIIGRWLWIKPTEHEYEILPNGTLICGGAVHGSWRPLDPNKKTYELFWRDRWTDTLTLSPDGNTLVGTNNEGEVIEAKRDLLGVLLTHDHCCWSQQTGKLVVLGFPYQRLGLVV
jgi:hypothetical protein